MANRTFPSGNKSAQIQLSRLEQIQDLAYSYGILGNTLSAFECYANRNQPNESIRTNVFSAYNNFNCGNVKTLSQLKAQMICQLTIMEFSFTMYTQSYGQYDYDQEMGKEALLELLNLWRNWVSDDDKKYYESAMTIVNGGKPIRYTDELKGDGKVNPNFLSNSVQLISNANKVGTDAVEEYKNSGAVPKMKINSTEVGNKDINITSEREDIRRYKNEELDELLIKVRKSLRTLGKNRKLTKQMIKREKKRLNSRIQTFFNVFNDYIAQYQLYWFKDNKESHHKEMKNIKELCLNLEEKNYDKEMVKEIINFCVPNSYL